MGWIKYHKNRIWNREIGKYIMKIKIYTFNFYASIIICAIFFTVLVCLRLYCKHSLGENDVWPLRRNVCEFDARFEFFNIYMFILAFSSITYDLPNIFSQFEIFIIFRLEWIINNFVIFDL